MNPDYEPGFTSSLDYRDGSTVMVVTGERTTLYSVDPDGKMSVILRNGDVLGDIQVQFVSDVAITDGGLLIQLSDSITGANALVLWRDGSSEVVASTGTSLGTVGSIQSVRSSFLRSSDEHVFFVASILTETQGILHDAIIAAKGSGMHRIDRFLDWDREIGFPFAYPVNACLPVLFTARILGE